MIQDLSTALLLTGGLLFIVFCFVDHAVITDDEDECTHENQATYDSVHKKVCIDCLTEFSTAEIKK